MGRWEGSEQCLVSGSGCEVDRGSVRTEEIVKKFAGVDGGQTTQKSIFLPFMFLFVSYIYFFSKTSLVFYCILLQYCYNYYAAFMTLYLLRDNY